MFFINGMHPGGKERRLIELLKFLLKHTAMELELVLMTREMKYPEVLTLGVKIHFLIRRTKKDIGAFYRFFRLCTESRPDVIHTWDTMTAVYAAPVAKLLGIRFINGMIVNAPRRVSPFSSNWIRSKITFPFSDVIVANSLAGLHAYKAPAKKSVCIYNGFDSARAKALVDAQVIRANFGIETPNVVGMVGEFVDKKDFACFIAAAHKILRVRNDVTFIAVGDGKNLDRCKALVERQCRNAIRFLGWQSDIESIVNMMTVGVLATDAAIHGEGISNSILEYMAMGKPVIATDSGGTKEIVVDGVTGFLARNKDVDELASRITALLDDRELAQQMGDRGKQRVKEMFSIESMAARYLELYNNGTVVKPAS